MNQVTRKIKGSALMKPVLFLVGLSLNSMAIAAVENNTLPINQGVKSVELRLADAMTDFFVKKQKLLTESLTNLVKEKLNDKVS